MVVTPITVLFSLLNLATGIGLPVLVIYFFFKCRRLSKEVSRLEALIERKQVEKQ